MNESSNAVQPLGRGVAILSLVVLGLVIVASGGLFALGEGRRLPAVLMAAAACWVGAVGGLTATVLANQLRQPIAGILGGMLVRFGVPLAIGAGFTLAKHRLADQGVFVFMLGFYLVVLAVETWLSLSYVSNVATVRQSADKPA